ncbi:hypothetical protein PINS_up002144 [Pythium insidiosum]|nr:hypothetical protein PINS_up002144 [Pythium insidiosum]
MLVLLGVLGVAVSAYGAYVEHQKRLDPANYSALCDFAGYSCSSVMTSEFGNMLRYHGLVDRGSWLDQPNAILGTGAYSLFVLYPILRKIPFHEYVYTLGSLIAVGLSVYLAYILAFVLRDLCMICVTSYVINAALAWYSFKLLRGGKVKTT